MEHRCQRCRQLVCNVGVVPFADDEASYVHSDHLRVWRCRSGWFPCCRHYQEQGHQRQGVRRQPISSHARHDVRIGRIFALVDIVDKDWSPSLDYVSSSRYCPTWPLVKADNTLDIRLSAVSSVSVSLPSEPKVYHGAGKVSLRSSLLGSSHPVSQQPLPSSSS